MKRLTGKHVQMEIAKSACCPKKISAAPPSPPPEKKQLVSICPAHNKYDDDGEVGGQQHSTLQNSLIPYSLSHHLLAYAWILFWFSLFCICIVSVHESRLRFAFETKKYPSFS